MVSKWLRSSVLGFAVMWDSKEVEGIRGGREAQARPGA
jgi:hypothetical protein